MMVCGYDESGPHINFTDSDLNLISVQKLSVGSGSRFALGILASCEDIFSLSDEDAYDLARKAIKTAANRDAASGGCRNCIYLILLFYTRSFKFN